MQAITLRVRCSLAGSFVVCSALGSTAIAWYWMHQGETTTAAVRAAGFVVLMALVHEIGFRLYIAQPAFENQGTRRADQCLDSPRITFQERLRLSLHPGLDLAIRRSLLQQIPILSLSLFLLDGGWTLRIFSFAAVAHRTAITIVAVRRSMNPTALDLAIIKYGYIPLTFIVWRIAAAIFESVGRP